MSSGTTPTPQAAAPAPQKSGSKVLLWVLGIVLAFIVLCVGCFVGLGFYAAHKVKQAGFDSSLMKKNPALALAKMAATADKNVEMVSSDDDAGTIVLRDKRTGKLTTMKFDPQTNSMVVIDDQGRQSTITADSSSGGTLSVKGPEGTFKMGAGADKSPSWVPVYPGATPQNNFSASDNEKQSGSYSFVTKDPLDRVIAFYADSLTSAGLSVSKASSSSAGHNTGVVTAQDKDSQRTVVVSADDESDGTHVSVTFEEKKH